MAKLTFAALEIEDFILRKPAVSRSSKCVPILKPTRNRSASASADAGCELSDISAIEKRIVPITESSAPPKEPRIADRRHVTSTPAKVFLPSIRSPPLISSRYVPKRCKRRHGTPLALEHEMLNAPRVSYLNNAPLTKFDLFPYLPLELRLKIWQIAMDEPRLIELERGPDWDYNEDDHHAFDSHFSVRVCAASRLSPRLMLVNTESRTEAKRFYQKRYFDTITRNDKQKPIWYNLRSDILLFGENTCVQTMWALSRIPEEYGQGDVEISAIAFSCRPKTEVCCFLNYPVWSFNRRLWIIRRLGREVLEILHGTSHTDRIPLRGIPGLKKVYVLVKSNYQPVPSGTVNEFVGLAPAVHSGINHEQCYFKTSFDLLLDDVKVDGAPARVVAIGGTKNWVGNDMPEFADMMLVPKVVGLDTRVHEVLPVTPSEYKKLCSKAGGSFLAALERETNCAIEICDYAKGGGQREIGVFGDREDILRVEKALKERFT